MEMLWINWNRIKNPENYVKNLIKNKKLSLENAADICYINACGSDSNGRISDENRKKAITALYIILFENPDFKSRDFICDGIRFEMKENPHPDLAQLIPLCPIDEKCPKRKRANLGPLRHEVLKRDDFKCVECGVTGENSELHVDHIIPVSQGGFDELDNLQTLCRECNLAKGNRAWKGGKQD